MKTQHKISSELMLVKLGALGLHPIIIIFFYPATAVITQEKQRVTQLAWFSVLTIFTALFLPNVDEAFVF